MRKLPKFTHTERHRRCFLAKGIVDYAYEKKTSCRANFITKLEKSMTRAEITRELISRLMEEKDPYSAHAGLLVGAITVLLGNKPEDMEFIINAGWRVLAHSLAEAEKRDAGEQMAIKVTALVFANELETEELNEEIRKILEVKK